MKGESIIDTISKYTVRAFDELFGESVATDSISITIPKKDIEADYTVVLFPFVKKLKKNPVELGNEVGDFLQKECEKVKSYSVAGGFLNLSLENSSWLNSLDRIAKTASFGHQPIGDQKIMIEYCSPNTNKPIHLGHMRNILLGHSCSEIYKAAGYDVFKTQIINDRGIAVCKSMYAWQEYGNGDTPDTNGTKGDFFVGDYYVLFNQKLSEEYKEWQNSKEAKELQQNSDANNAEDFFKSYKNDYFNKQSKIGNDTKDMLMKWESGDEDTVALWKRMNDWVYDGWWKTFDALQIEFDENYYESNTYKLGKKVVEQGLESSTFFKKEDGSVWVDLEDVGMDKKILLRSDGTAVYMTQDLGTAIQRYEDHSIERMVYVVGDEQEYHFKVLFEVLKRMGEPYAEKMHHLAYGMVELPTGKMKSREGSVVDADDLMEEVIQEAKSSSEERGGIEGISDDEKSEIYRKVGIAALKYQLLKVQARKRMIFDPKESVDMQGQTGPYIQNAFVRIQSILRKFESENLKDSFDDYDLHNDEKMLIRMMLTYPNVIQQAAREFDPSLVANFSYQLAKQYHKFYHDFSILKAESKSAQSFRIALNKEIAKILKDAMHLLGIEMPKRM